MSVIGIDLGTTLSCVAVLKNERIEIVPNNEGDRLTPSYVSFSGDEVLTGKAAKYDMDFNHRNILYQIKRLIGKKYNDPILQGDLKLWGFEVINKNNCPIIQVDCNHDLKLFHPEQISSTILLELKHDAETYMGSTITDAVITVPAYFNSAQRKSTKEAGKIAGLNVLQILNEPTAAAIAYKLHHTHKHKACNVLIFDLGGGTFDVSVITIRGEVFDIKATGGDAHLGGEDFDNRMVQYCIQEFYRQTEVDLSKNKRALSRLKMKCEDAKKKLSVSVIAKINVDSIHSGIDFKATISRAKFEDINNDYFAKTLHGVQNTLNQAKMTKDKIDEIVLIGGSTRIPKIQEMLKRFFNGKQLNNSINPDEAVAYGAAVYATALIKQKFSERKYLMESKIFERRLEQQRKARQTFVYYISDIEQYFTCVGTHKLSSHETQLIFRRCDNESNWIEEHKMSNIGELEKRQQHFEEFVRHVIYIIRRRDKTLSTRWFN
uniref:heat shock 70 kDa protein II-like n=1 Tax=Styela clava TaxID=7725 RepID=UPI00193A072F|nr:heat shock 70 kDa protein II-like [Styela clava]